MVPQFTVNIRSELVPFKGATGVSPVCATELGRVKTRAEQLEQATFSVPVKVFLKQGFLLNIPLMVNVSRLIG